MMGLLNGRLSREAKRLIRIFTLVETITLTIWIYLVLLGVNAAAKGDLAAAAGYALLAIIELYIGLLIEHRIAGVSTKV